MQDGTQRIGPHGVGVTYRSVIHDDIMRARAMIDFLELPTEDYADPARRERADPGEILVTEAARHFPLVAHGTRMSVGSGRPLDADYLERVAEFVDRTPVAAYSEHLAFVRAGKEEVSKFLCIPFTDLGVSVAAANARRVAKRLGLPFLLENVSYYFSVPGATMTEGEFLRRVAEQADCGILFDVANAFINGRNHGYDPCNLMRGLPADRVLQCHFCGATEDRDGFLLDTHCEVTPGAVWNLLEETLRHTALSALTLERDSEFHPFRAVLEELWQARMLFLRYRSPVSPSDRIVNRAPVVLASDEDPVEGAKDLETLQTAMVDLLLNPKLATAVDREGEAALRHTGLASEERRLLSQIPVPMRERIGRNLRSEKNFLWMQKQPGAAAADSGRPGASSLRG